MRYKYSSIILIRQKWGWCWWTRRRKKKEMWYGQRGSSLSSSCTRFFKLKSEMISFQIKKSTIYRWLACPSLKSLKPSNWGMCGGRPIFAIVLSMYPIATNLSLISVEFQYQNQTLNVASRPTMTHRVCKYRHSGKKKRGGCWTFGI